MYVRYIGKIRYNIDLTNELIRLAESDEVAGSVLEQAGHYRQAIYLYQQAMEKRIRSAIFGVVDPLNPFFREFNQHHSLADSMRFFVQIITPDITKRDFIANEIEGRIIRSTNFNFLHNQLRYAFFSEKFQSYSIVDFDKNDAIDIHQRLDNLKEFMIELEKMR